MIASRVFSFFVLAFACLAATADTLQFAFSGTVNLVSDPNNVLGGSLSLGDPLTGSMSFDSASINSGTSSDNGVYVQIPPLELETRVGPYVARTVGPTETFRIEVGDNIPGTGDRYFAHGASLVTGPLPPLASALSRFTMLDATGGAFASISLPQLPPDINLFAGRSVTLRLQTIDNRVALIRSTVDELVLSQPGGSLRGVVTLLDFEGDLGQSTVTIEVRNHGSEIPLESHVVPLDSFGAFVCPTSLNGFYDVAIKGSHHLRKTLQFVFIDLSGTSGLEASLINGDADSDNEVTLVDFAAISNAFGTANGDVGFNTNADLNGDGEVNLFDVAILSNQFGLAGDP